MKRVNKHTRAGQRGKIIQCPKCNYQSVSYHFAWGGSGCVGCHEMIDKYDYLIPELTQQQDSRVRNEQYIDNSIRHTCYELNKDLMDNMDNYWKEWNKLYKKLKKKIKTYDDFEKFYECQFVYWKEE